MANYRPKARILAATLADSGTAVQKDITTTTWGMFLLQGTALSPLGTALASGAVQVWESGTATTATANHTTFADISGSYGVTCKANVGLVIKFFGA